MSMPRSLTIMGSTGSIGTSALSVVQHANSLSETPVFSIDTLAAGSNASLLAEQAIAVGAKQAVIADEAKLAELQERLSGTGVLSFGGAQAVKDAACRPVDRVLAAIVGIDGLASTYAAVEAGNSVALANKESMVCAGPLLKQLAKQKSVAIIPTDSEHNAMFQVMERREDVERLILTASGGPFRKTSMADLESVTPEKALAHPRWEMGRKISIDSSTLFNKGLELIEAAYLFDVPEDQIEVVIHPQSILHSAVAYRDGSVLAQMGMPDMRTPIAHALTWPERRQPAPVEALDLIALGRLEFEDLDSERFPAIELAREAIRLGGGAPTVLNCANEGAVAAFLAGQCRFLDISWVVEKALNRFVSGPLAAQATDSLEAVMAVEAEAGRLTGALLAEANSRRVGV
ncbi:MAG: 1-deoxy-D-xylulose-5-phosphate reductoisomerase [Henriciella sp.]|nr:1-deoxy-D-xylulose-5-phosphate reductoisomerase [Henriciella sp.]